MLTIENRPRKRPALTFFDNILERTGYVLLAAMWLLTIVGFCVLPDTIPTHYGLAGNPDAFGSRYSYIILPLVGTGLFLSMTVLNRYPWFFNYPSELTNATAEVQYRNSTRAIRFLKTSIQLIFFGIQLFTLLIAFHTVKSLGAWFVPVVVLLALVIPVVLIFSGTNKNKPE